MPNKTKPIDKIKGINNRLRVMSRKYPADQELADNVEKYFYELLESELRDREEEIEKELAFGFELGWKAAGTQYGFEYDPRRMLLKKQETLDKLTNKPHDK